MHVAAAVGAWARRQAARTLIRQGVELHVSGLEHVPRSGAALLVARHVHHLYDAAAILASVPREVHIVVAVDWLDAGWKLRLMQQLANAARWPTVWRRGPHWHFNRRSYEMSLELLRGGEVLLVFPEGYPVIDPHPGARRELDSLLPFDPGFAALARPGVPVVPVGLSYAPRERGRWQVQLRYGIPRVVLPGQDRRALAAAVESTVRELSAPPRE